MKKIIALLMFILSVSIGNAQSDNSETTIEPTTEQVKEMEQVKRKVEKSKDNAKKAKKEAKELKKTKKLKKELSAKEKSISKLERQVEKLERDLEKGKLKGTLSPVDIQKINNKILKVKMKIVEEHEKLNKIKRKI